MFNENKAVQKKQLFIYSSRPKILSKFNISISVLDILHVSTNFMFRKAAQLVNPRKQIQLEDFLTPDLKKQMENSVDNVMM